MGKLTGVIVIFLFAINLYPQEIGISPVKLWTNNREIENPIGYGIHAFLPMGKFGVKFEYMAAKNERSYYGFVSGGFIISPEDFIQESITSKSSYRAFEFSAHIPRLFEFYQIYLNIGAGMTFDKFTRNKTGLSSGKEYSISENKFGVFYAISLSRYDIFGLPLKMEILFKHKGLAAGNYATDSDQPFVEAMDIKELQLNFAYMF